MMTRRSSVVPVVLALSATSVACSDQPEPLYAAEAVIAATRVPCTGVDSQLCLQISEDGGPVEWFYGGIEGFTFHWGRETRLRYSVYEVVDPPEDASSRRYVLDEVIDVDFDALGPTFDLAFPDPAGASPWFSAGAAAGQVLMVDTAVACEASLCDALLAAPGAFTVTFELNVDDAVPLRALAVEPVAS